MKKNVLVLLMSCLTSIVFGTNIQLTFAARGSSDSVETVTVKNLTTGASITLQGSDTLKLNTAIEIGLESITDNGATIKVVPNPVKQEGILYFTVPTSGRATIRIVNQTGTLLAEQSADMQAGVQSYSVRGLPSGVCFVSITGNAYSLSAKIVSTGSSSQAPSLQPIQSIAQGTATVSSLKNLKSEITMSYTSGDVLRFIGASETYTDTIDYIPTIDTTITFTFVVTDGDGNTYKTVTIGTQTWFAENLKVTTYNDGTAIPNVTDDDAWAALTTGAQCTYNNTTDADTINKYGRLYNWYAVDTASNGGKNICPTGWHVPSDAEWTTLENYLIANGYNYDGSTDNDGDRSTLNKIGKALASTSGWTSYSTVGAVGNNQTTNNKSGFTALPGGYRDGFNGSFSYSGDYGGWWSSTEDGSYGAYDRDLYDSGGTLNRDSYIEQNGYSVRCIKN